MSSNSETFVNYLNGGSSQSDIGNYIVPIFNQQKTKSISDHVYIHQVKIKSERIINNDFKNVSSFNWVQIH